MTDLCQKCKWFQIFTFKDLHQTDKSTRTQKYTRERCGFSGMVVEPDEAPVLKCNRFEPDGTTRKGCDCRSK